MDDVRITLDRDSAPKVVTPPMINAYTARKTALRAAWDEVAPDGRSNESWEIACPAVRLTAVAGGLVVYRAEIVAHRHWVIFQRAIDQFYTIDVDPATGAVVGIDVRLDAEE